jgi:enoyl-CoA hydratase/carnithine racemase
VITLNRPAQKNALSIALRDEVSDALQRLADDETTRVVVFTGEGPVFSAGFDLHEFSDAESQQQLWQSSDRFHHAVLRFPLPTIAAVNGPAIAGGFDLACLADIRVAAEGARFAHPEHDWAPVVYRPLHNLIGGSVARELLLTGRTIDAAEALRIGLVSAVTSADGLLPEALSRAKAIASAPREVLLAMKAKIIAVADISEDLPTLEI